MARQKQATPLRRTVSSEYTSAADRKGAAYRRTKPNSTELDLPERQNNSNGHTFKAASSISEPKKQAGLLELVAGVLGIYASL